MEERNLNSVIAFGMIDENGLFVSENYVKDHKTEYREKPLLADPQYPPDMR
jgi:hypothetical protein